MWLRARRVQRRVRHVGAASVLAFFVLTLFAHLLFTNRVLASGDILLYFYPYRDYAASILRTGHIPLWNPYIFLGAPFLANPQAAVLYPLHWPLIGLPVTQQIYWSAALHTWLLGLGGYLLARRWGGGPWAALTTGLVLAGSGFYGGLIGHLNQMNGAAWLPWLLLIADAPIPRPTKPSPKITSLGARARAPVSLATVQRVLLRAALLAILVALMLLAGHTQTAYINLFGLGVWLVCAPLLQTAWRQPLVRKLRRSLPHLARGLSILLLGCVLGALLSSAQLAPTWELRELGLRSGGLSYADATSFSLRPLHLLWTLLPSYGLVDLGVVFNTAGYTEFVAYIGLLGLLLATVGAWRGRGRARAFGLLFVGLGLFLAAGRWNPLYYLLYRLVPGFDLFRVPARWMMLYTLGAAVLAGVGVDCLLSRLRSVGRLRWRSLAAGVLLGALTIELMVAARALPHTQTTAPQAVYDVRTAPAHLLTDPARAVLHPAAMGRFLSMSNTTFDPGDMADYGRIFTQTPPVQLDDAAFTQLIVALKAQEILAPNLPLLWRIPAVDGFDGGVLPLQRYLRALTLFIPPERLVPDGRLREQLGTVPPAALLDLFNIQYVITDKVHDLWWNGVYYDRQVGARLSAAAPDVSIDASLPFEATRLDLLGYVDGSAQTLSQMRAQNRPVAQVHIQPNAASAGSPAPSFMLTAGGVAQETNRAHFADGALDSPLAAASGAQVAYRDVEGGAQEYLASFKFAQPIQPEAVIVERAPILDTALNGTLDVVIRAVTLVDERTGAFVPLIVSDRGDFRLAHGGDVKLYENQTVRPRAYLAPRVQSARDTDHALRQLQAHIAERSTATQGVSDDMVGENVAIVEGLASFTSRTHPTDEAEIVAYEAERVVIRTRSRERAFLVLSDSYYPGWRARVNGAETPVYAANVVLRGVVVPPGEHHVEFVYRPQSWRWGLWLSGLGAALWLACVGGALTFRAMAHRARARNLAGLP